jgi:hypothetical protein
VKRFRLNAATLIVFSSVALAALLGGSAAAAATVFSNYTGLNCRCGYATGVYAAGFTPTSDFDFAGAAAFVENSIGSDPETFTMALVSSNGGSPDATLWTSGTLSTPPGDGSANLVAASYAGEPIPIQTGVLYFLALNISEIDNPLWLGDGSSSGPLFGAPHEGSPWNSLGPGNLQFQVFGAASAGAPVPNLDHGSCSRWGSDWRALGEAGATLPRRVLSRGAGAMSRPRERETIRARPPHVRPLPEWA